MFSGALYPGGIGLHMHGHVHTFRHNNTHVTIFIYVHVSNNVTERIHNVCIVHEHEIVFYNVWLDGIKKTHILYIVNQHTHTAFLALVGIPSEVKSGGVSLSQLSLSLHTSAMLCVRVCAAVSKKTRETDALYVVCVRWCTHGGEDSPQISCLHPLINDLCPSVCWDPRSFLLHLSLSLFSLFTFCLLVYLSD